MEHFKTCSSQELRMIPIFGRWIEQFGRSMMKLRYSESQGMKLLDTLWEAGLQNSARYMLTGKKGLMIIVLLPEPGKGQLVEMNMLIKRVRFQKLMGKLTTSELEQMLLLGHDMLWEAQHGDAHPMDFPPMEADELPF